LGIKINKQKKIIQQRAETIEVNPLRAREMERLEEIPIWNWNCRVIVVFNTFTLQKDMSRGGG
jgi:hypothetical protein